MLHCTLISSEPHLSSDLKKKEEDVFTVRFRATFSSNNRKYSAAAHSSVSVALSFAAELHKTKGRHGERWAREKEDQKVNWEKEIISPPTAVSFLPVHIICGFSGLCVVLGVCLRECVFMLGISLHDIKLCDRSEHGRPMMSAGFLL